MEKEQREDLAKPLVCNEMRLLWLYLGMGKVIILLLMSSVL